MKTFKEYLGMPSVGIGPAADINKPMASLNSPHQFYPNKRYATTFSQYKGPGMGTIKPMLTANKESDKALHLKLIAKALKTMAGSQKQKEIKQQINVIRKRLGLEPVNEISDKLKSKVLQRKIDRAKTKMLSKKRLQQP